MGYIQGNKEAWEEAFEASNNHFEKEDVEKIRNTKFADDFGIAYMNGGQDESKVFTSFSYKMSDVISGICKNDMQIMNFTEYDYDIGGEFRHLDGQGFPLSFMVVAQKQKL